jgi:autotransporter-associated beta strand protein
LNGDVVVEAGLTNSIIEGSVYCGGPRRFTVQSPAVTNNLELSARVSGLAAGTLTKAGPGWMTMSGSNVYAGLTVVEGGVLRISGPRPLGQTTQGTHVNAGGTLYLDGIDVADEPLRLAGAGSNGLGALNGISASWDGDITLAAEAGVASWPGSALRLTGALTGAGGLRVQGGTVALAGTTASTYTGDTHVDGGTLELRKQIIVIGGSVFGIVSVPGSLFIGDSSGTDTVRLFADDSIGDAAAVSLAPNGVLDINGHSEVVGSLSGLSGAIALGDGELTAGGNGQSTVCGAVLSGTGRFRKVGPGALTLTAAQLHTGGTFIEGGTLIDNGALKNVTVKTNGVLAGNGQADAVTLQGGILSPGAPFGRITTKNLIGQAASALRVELNGTQAGVNYDQVQVNGVVTLAGAALEVSLSHNGGAGQQYVILSNDGVDAIIGTFTGKPQGATFASGGAQFQISYTGGDGNDVVLTQLTASAQFPPPVLTVETVGSTQARVSWTTNAVGFQLQSTADLLQPAWASVPYPMVPLGALNTVTVPSTNGPASAFFRLVKP